MPYKEVSVEKMYFTIGEVSQMIGESTSLVRFWSDKFSDIIKPERNRKGNRRYTAKDVDNIKLIYHLVKERGMTLEGALERIKNNREGLDNRVEVVERLKGVKEMLIEVSKSLSE